MITNNFALREVSTAAYDEQQIHLWSIVVDGRQPQPWRFTDEFQ
jgi:hypothetical protein